MVSSQMEQQIVARLHASDIRYTPGRRTVVQALSVADGPRSASDLHADLGEKIPLSSLYRSLSTLTDAGVLAPHHGSRGITRYELAEWLMGHHHHLLCNICGAMHDIELPREQEHVLRDIASSASIGRDFVATGHSLEIGGHCRTCP